MFKNITYTKSNFTVFILRYGFCKKLHRYKWISDQLNIWFICTEVTSYEIHILALSKKRILRNSELNKFFSQIKLHNFFSVKSKGVKIGITWNSIKKANNFEKRNFLFVKSNGVKIGITWNSIKKSQQLRKTKTFVKQDES